MSSEVKVQEQALQRSTEIVVATHEELRSRFSALRGDVASIGAQWEGAGKGAFDRLMVSWDEQANRVARALDRFESNLRKADQTFTVQDEQVQASMNKFAATLGGN